LHKGIGEARAARGQGIKIGRAQKGMPSAAHMVVPQLIGHDEEHVAHWLNFSLIPAAA